MKCSPTRWNKEVGPTHGTASLNPKHRRCPECMSEMHSRPLSHEVELLVSCTTLILCLNHAPAFDSHEVCDTPICRNVSTVYEETVNSKLNPCDDFSTYVCHGWLHNLIEKFPVVTCSSTNSLRKLQERVMAEILTHQMERIRHRLSNSSAGEFRLSEIQSTQFYMSCIHDREFVNWEQIKLTMRKFFHEIDLPFFDELRGPGQSPFAVMMKLALHFEVEPLFQIDLKGYHIYVKRSSDINMTKPARDELPKVQDTINRFRSKLLNLSNNTYSD